MGKAVFVSYKYSDSNVLLLPNALGVTRARHYVDEIEKYLEVDDHVYKGEDDGESMKALEDSTISSKLGDKIFSSSITIVLISRGMKQLNLQERDQWIPWEVSYSLKEQRRNGQNSKTNAILAVVLPDNAGSYGYFITENPQCNSITYHTGFLFQILRENMFNHKKKDAASRICNGQMIYDGFPSYVYPVKSEEFILDVSSYLKVADRIRQNLNDYNIVKAIN
jgi:hypothetical protein